MSRANNKGWDFVKVGRIYQYKEDCFIATVKVIEDKSDAEYYRFTLEVLSSNMKPPRKMFTVSHIKELNGVYSGMLQMYEKPEYFFPVVWEKEQNV